MSTARGSFHQILGRILLAASAVTFAMHGQGLGVTPAKVDLRMVTGGPSALPQKVSIAGTNASPPVQWTAAVTGDAPWLVLSAATGTTPSTLLLSLVPWRAAGQPPGTYPAKIAFSANGKPQASVDVTWTVVPRIPDPTYTYPSGPHGCTQPAGYPDPALCTVPDEKPPGAFQPPPIGGSYVDPNFGGTVRIMGPPDYVHTYSNNNPLSAHNKYLMAFSDGAFFVIDVATHRFVYSRIPGNQDFFWDSYDDEVYYYPAGSRFIRHNLHSGKETTVVDYARGSHRFTLLKRGGTTASSKDNWISFYAPNEQQVCALDIGSAQTYCASYAGVYPGIDYVLDAKGVDKASGKRYVIVVATAGSAMAAYSVNLAAQKLDLEYRGPEEADSKGNHDGICDPGEKCMMAGHSDTFEDAAGGQFLIFSTFTEMPCEVSISTYQLNRGMQVNQPVELGGGRRKILSLWQCPFPNDRQGTDEHIGCAKNAPFCVISTVPPYRTQSEPPVRFPHATEIMVMRGNGLELRRLAESRSVRFMEEGDEAYWAEPRAAISNDGSLVVSDSNFGERRGVRITLIPTGFGPQ